MKRFAMLDRLGRINTVIFMVILGFYSVYSLFCRGVNASADDYKIVHKIEIPEGTVTLILEQISGADQTGYAQLSLMHVGVESHEDQIEEVLIPETVPLPDGRAGKIVTAGTNALSELKRKFPSKPLSHRVDIIDPIDPVGGTIQSRKSINHLRLESRFTVLSKGFFSGIFVANISIPDSIKIIEAECFNCCTKLNHIEIPNSVRSIENDCFSNCHHLENLQIPDSVMFIGKGCFSKCGFLNKMTIPHSIECIPEECFEACYSLKELKILASVKEIGRSCFEGCHALAELEIPDSVQRIGNYCFRSCSSLIGTVLPENVEFIGEFCFDNCYSLQRVKLPSQLKSLQMGCFSKCKSLQEIIIPGSVVFIGEACFENCRGLRRIKIPDSVKQIGKDCFRNCRELTELVVPNFVKSIEDKGTIECTAQNIFPIFYTIKFPLHSATLSACLDVVVIPLSVRKLPDRSFFNCKNISGILFLSDKVESLGDDCFNGCLNLERINLPEGIWHIGSGCFKNCHILSCTWLKFTSSNDITIGEGAFEGCSCLQSLSLPLDRTIWLPNCFKGTGIM